MSVSITSLSLIMNGKQKADAEDFSNQFIQN